MIDELAFEKAFQIGLAMGEKQPGGIFWVRKFLEAYEAAKSGIGKVISPEQPVGLSLSDKIDNAVKNLAEQQGDDKFKKLFWEIARTLKCLPSCFADGNGHVLLAAEKAMMRETIKPTEAMCDRARGFIMGLDLGARNWRHMDRHLEAGGYNSLPYIKSQAKENPHGHITKWDVAECIYMLMTTEIEDGAAQ